MGPFLYDPLPHENMQSRASPHAALLEMLSKNIPNNPKAVQTDAGGYYVSRQCMLFAIHVYIRSITVDVISLQSSISPKQLNTYAHQYHFDGYKVCDTIGPQQLRRRPLLYIYTRWMTVFGY